MADVHGAMPLAERLQLKQSLLENADPFIKDLPKVELHIHIEGIMTPAMKWKFMQRNGQNLRNRRTDAPFKSLEELEDYFDFSKQRDGKRMTNEEETALFFEAFNQGPEVLQTKQDYYDLAMHYFEKAAAANVRYAEIFFDPQMHTCWYTTWETMMGGFHEAQEVAERDLNVGRAYSLSLRTGELTTPGPLLLDHVHPARPLPGIRVGTLLRSSPLPRHDLGHRARL